LTAPGGQAGSSSRIENYLGFPSGISGQDLATRAYTQAQKFGADVLIARSAVRLACGRTPYAVELDGGTRIPARTIIIATGTQYRRQPLENLSRFEGAGVHYSATFMEAQLCGGDEVIVVGGGNSAGQAAVFLAGTARRVYVLVRSSQLADTMSRYLVRRIEDNPAIVLHTRTEIVALGGTDRLEHVRWRHSVTGAVDEHAIRHVFVMTGASPNTGWLDGCVALDERDSLKRDRICSPTTCWRAAGRSRVGHTCLKPACQGFLPSATSDQGISSAWRRPWARARSQFPLSTRCYTSSKRSMEHHEQSDT